jgi:hypothetical protein
MMNEVVVSVEGINYFFLGASSGFSPRPVRRQTVCVAFLPLSESFPFPLSSLNMSSSRPCIRNESSIVIIECILLGYLQ